MQGSWGPGKRHRLGVEGTGASGVEGELEFARQSKMLLQTSCSCIIYPRFSDVLSFFLDKDSQWFYFTWGSSAVCVEHLVECRELKAWWCPLHILTTLVGLVFCCVLFSFVFLFVGSFYVQGSKDKSELLGIDRAEWMIKHRFFLKLNIWKAFKKNQLYWWF